MQSGWPFSESFGHHPLCVMRHSFLLVTRFPKSLYTVKMIERIVGSQDLGTI